jgi:5-methylcytosine-specific restriction endonuclease McrA
MRERKQSHRSGNSVLVMCDGCRDAIFRERSARAASERAAQEERLWELRTMPYREYLLTPGWQARRLQQFKRAGYRCQVCNTNRAQLNVHHRTYERRGDESFKDLVVLCADCHTIFHQQGKLARE